MKCGDKFKHQTGDIYILVRLVAFDTARTDQDNTICGLVRMRDGRPWSYGFLISDYENINNFEADQIFGSRRNEFTEYVRRLANTP